MKVINVFVLPFGVLMIEGLKMQQSTNEDYCICYKKLLNQSDQDQLDLIKPLMSSSSFSSIPTTNHLLSFVKSRNINSQNTFNDINPIKSNFYIDYPLVDYINRGTSGMPENHGTLFKDIFLKYNVKPQLQDSSRNVKKIIEERTGIVNNDDDVNQGDDNILQIYDDDFTSLESEEINYEEENEGEGRDLSGTLKNIPQTSYIKMYENFGSPGTRNLIYLKSGSGGVSGASGSFKSSGISGSAMYTKTTNYRSVPSYSMSLDSSNGGGRAVRYGKDTYTKTIKATIPNLQTINLPSGYQIRRMNRNGYQFDTQPIVRYSQTITGNKSGGMEPDDYQKVSNDLENNNNRKFFISSFGSVTMDQRGLSQNTNSNVRDLSYIGGDSIRPLATQLEEVKPSPSETKRKQLVVNDPAEKMARTYIEVPPFRNNQPSRLLTY